jgi:NAD(P)-dependent dehydrogenase (short-subunit alcohol dehydrogenase family)
MADSTFDLTGKTALVTGGNGGIGLGMAEALAQSGADICIWGQNEEKNKAAVEKLTSYGRKVVAFKCNVSDENQVEENFTRMDRNGYDRTDFQYIGKHKGRILIVNCFNRIINI